jgi:hypothetical protein
MRGAWSWQWLRHSLSPAVLGLVLALAGCATVYPDTPAGSGTYSYTTGTLSWIYPVPLERLWPVTLAEAEALRLRVEHEAMDGLGATLEALRADNTKIVFTLEPVSPNATKLKVQIGGMEWHRREAERIHAGIRRRLGLEKT